MSILSIGQSFIPESEVLYAIYAVDTT